MKTELKTIERKQDDITYPLLARSTTNEKELVVLFLQSGDAVVLVPGEGWKAGMVYSRDLVDSPFDPSQWEILPPGSSITLTQE